MRTDAELLRSFTPEAFGAFFERHAGTVTAYLGRGRRRPEVVIDLLAETFARALEHRQHYEPRKGPAIAWLLGIARHVVSDAERRGTVPDAARTRLGMEPLALDDAALQAVAARSQADFVEALSALPESQRIVVFRRVLGDEDYDYAVAPVGPSKQVMPAPAARRPRDPFELLHERLFVAAGGRIVHSRSRLIAIAATVVLLAGAAVATAAITLSGGEEAQPPASGQAASPTPTPTPSLNPGASPDPSPSRPRTPRGTAPSPGSGGAPVQPVPTPVPVIEADLKPDLVAGHAGWCVSVTVEILAIVTGGRECHAAGPPGTMLIASGVIEGAGYAIVDRGIRELRLSDGRRVMPERASGIPAGWRIATWPVDLQPPTFTLHDSGGQEIAPRGSAAIGPRKTRRVPAADPPRERCAIRAKRGSGLRPRRARLLDNFATLSLVSPSYLSCASTSFRLEGRTLRAGVLLNPRDLDAPTPPLPSTDGIATRREGPGRLVVTGGTKAQRNRVLRALSVTGP